MPKKPKNWIDSLTNIQKVVIISMLVGGVLISFSRQLITYVDLPKEVEANTSKVESIQDYIREQRIQNDLIRKQNEFIQKQIQQNKEPIISKDGRWFLDEKTGQWRPIKYLGK